MNFIARYYWVIIPAFMVGGFLYFFGQVMHGINNMPGGSLTALQTLITALN